ncbi:V-set and transmembrane domain-containing protein 5 isoform X2 [Rhinatrema bivittatum]|uniref:V-set and transmembrane domain-containing protein 5 isoform X2 n=1 Tax=Rhinatrema bivittatum TaxID=194408 RepID=UPI00112D1AA3|nr:V-set and transmembrane domain-containing protein 5 isoform X2 [Rhinatrema bivittatum]
MRTPAGRRPGSFLLLALCSVELCLPGLGITLLVPQPIINATAAQNILLPVEHACIGTPAITWEYMSNWGWGMQNIISWKAGIFVNVSKSYDARVHRYENGSIQLLNIGTKDAGYYVVTVMEELGGSKHGIIILNVYEVLYEDLHFVAVFTAFLAAVAAVLICFLWFCDKFVHIFQKRKWRLKDIAVRKASQ